eukprot:g3952.t1
MTPCSATVWYALLVNASLRRSALAFSSTRSVQPAAALSTAMSRRRGTSGFVSGGAVGDGRRAAARLARGSGCLPSCSSLTAVNPGGVWVQQQQRRHRPLGWTGDGNHRRASGPKRSSAGVLEGGSVEGGIARRGISMSAAAESSSAVVGAADTRGEERTHASKAAGDEGMRVTLLSGFLGAGKTTLMQNVIRQAKEEQLSLAVIVNDMADVNIDAQILGLGGNEEESGGGLSASAASAAGDTDVSAVTTVGEDVMVEMDGGCICCTLKDDLLREVEAIARRGKHQHLIIESTGISDPMPVAEALVYSDHDHEDGDQNADGDDGVADVDQDEAGNQIGERERAGEGELYSVDTLVTVVDSTTFLEEVRVADYLEDRGMEAQEGDTRTIADLLVTQVEFANVILLNKADLMADADLADLEAVVRKLNPSARVVRTVSSGVDLAEVLGTGVFDLDEASQAAGWVKALNDDNDDEEGASASPARSRRAVTCYDDGNDAGQSGQRAARDDEKPGGARSGASTRKSGGLVTDIGSFTFRAEIPFHPERLMGFVMEHLPSVLRSKGFLWLATRNDEAGVWTQAGGSFATEYGGLWDDEEGGDAGDAGETNSGRDQQRGTHSGEGEAMFQDGTDGATAVSTGSGSPGDGEVGGGFGGDDDDDDASGNARRTELVFIGLGMDDDALKAELERCLLTEEEMAGGPAAWRERFEDPFPPWQ